MSNNPVFLVILGLAGLMLGKMWLDDMRAARAGRPHPRALPGATPARISAILIAVLGALVLLAVETLGENALGLSAEQSRITWLFGAYSLTAAIIEEVVFRGYLVIEGRGRAALWAGILGASVLFAVLHPFLWRWDDHGFALTFTAKGTFSSVIVFATSLWLYAARFGSWNPTRSLLPCIAGHAAKNAGVIVIKFAQGFVSGAW
ncbi:MAG TPA: CPBP family intramembrane glutamic endopeptidase [Opitutus sp.]|nr:CPBP family intramembrane glutamic endopeptidase [Opitutus sp.]